VAQALLQFVDIFTDQFNDWVIDRLIDHRFSLLTDGAGHNFEGSVLGRAERGRQHRRRGAPVPHQDDGDSLCEYGVHKFAFRGYRRRLWIYQREFIIILIILLSRWLG